MLKRVGVTHGNPEKAKPYVDALQGAGIEPLLIRPGERTSVEGLDGLLITGGPDLNPRLYNQAKDPAAEQPDDERDALEKLLLEDAMERDLPVLAICRGMQLFNVAHGGTLHQHIENHRQPGVDNAHRIHVKPDTRLAEIIDSGAHTVNSRHHQAIGEVGRGLAVSAKSDDGHIEALERADKKFAVAVQWHPEDLVEKDVEAKKLFEAFAKAL